MLEKILSDLISLPTVSNSHAENAKAFAWIKNQLKNTGAHFQDHASNGFPSLVITTRKTKSPKLFLLAHMDVVDGSSKMFKARLKKSKLIGRGAFDMKFAIACYIKLFKELENLKDYDIGVMLTSDEEIGGENGVGSLVKRGYSPEFVFLPDGGENWSLQKSAKGVYQVNITSKGKSAHGARPWLGDNAIENLFSVLISLKQQFPIEPCGDEEHFHDTINIGKIKAGEAINQVPREANADIDIRYTPKTSLSTIKKRIQKATKAFPNIQVKEITYGNSYAVDRNNLFIKEYLRILKRRGINPTFINSHGSSDARFFVEKNIPVLLTRPVGGNLHSEDEWIGVRELNKFYEILKEFVTHFKRN